MSVQIPSPQTLAQRRVTALSQQDFLDENGKPCRLDASSPQTFEQILCGVLGIGDYETRLWQRDDFKELMIQTSTLGGLLPLHAQQWNVPRRGPQKSSGNVVISATQDVTLPLNALLTSDGTIIFATDKEIDIPAYVPTSVHVTCKTVGILGNLGPNIELTLVNPVAGIAKIISDDSGFSGGNDIENISSWKDRIIKNVRRFYGGGTKMDYEEWSEAWGASFYRCVPSYWGAGTVGVIFAMAGGIAPTDEQVQSLTDFMNDGRRPVRGNLRVYPAKIMKQVISVMLNPDTDSVRSAFVAAVTPLILSVGIGGTLYKAAIESALYTIAGVKSKLISPKDDIVFHVDEMPVLDHVEFVASAS